MLCKPQGISMQLTSRNMKRLLYGRHIQRTISENIKINCYKFDRIYYDNYFIFTWLETRFISFLLTYTWACLINSVQ